MSAKDTLENMARNTWLAGLGSIDSSKETLGKSIDAAQEKSNNLYSELLTRGEEIQNKINDKKDEIQAKGKKFLGMNDKSQEEKLAQLSMTVDKLTDVVVKLVEKRSAEEAAAAKPAAKAKAAPKAAKATETAKKVAKPAAKTTAKKTS